MQASELNPDAFSLVIEPAIDPVARKNRLLIARKAAAWEIKRVLNLGAGVQSTAVYVMDSMVHHQSRRNEVESWLGRAYPFPPLDLAVFADTQEEPDAVYAHLASLKEMAGAKILEGTAGRIGDDLIRGTNGTDRFASIPAFTSAAEGERGGMTRRQCTSAYKVNVVERIIRREVLGLAPGEAAPERTLVIQSFGVSWDEPARVAKVKARLNAKGWASPHFPLCELEMERTDCVAFLASVGITAPRSACVFCPFHSNAEWRHLRDNDPGGWGRACAVDEQMRRAESVCSRALSQRLYVHRSCVPLARAPIDERDEGLLFLECEGMCGS